MTAYDDAHQSLCAPPILLFFLSSLSHTRVSQNKKTNRTTQIISPTFSQKSKHYFFSALCTPERMSGSSKLKPAAVNFLGTARCPPSSISFPISPNKAWAAGAGKGKICVCVSGEERGK